MGGMLDRMNREMNRVTLERLEPGPGDRLLEVGFGGGDLLARLLSGPCAFAAGVDLSPEMVARARRRLRAALRAGRAEVRQGSVESLPFPDASFTRLCSVNTLYFWPSLEGPLRECRRVLRPGGLLVLTFDSPEELARWPGHRHGFRLRGLPEVRHALADAGFRSIEAVEGRFHCVRARAPG